MLSRYARQVVFMLQNGSSFNDLHQKTTGTTETVSLD